LADLGDDITICAGSQHTLNTGDDPQNIFDWTTGENTSSITVTEAGTYRVFVENAFNCTAQDEINVMISNPMISLGQDVTICPGETVTLTAPSGFSSYRWSTSATSAEISVTPGNYSLTATDDFGCSAFDEISIIALSAQAVSAGNDQSVCPGQAFSVAASSGFNNYHWSTGANSQAINPSLPGSYIVTAYDGNGCASSDEVSLTIKPLPVVDLGANRVLCYGETINLSAGAGYQSYLWNNGSVSPTINVNAAGVFSVVVTGTNGCVAFDQIQIVATAQLVITTESIINVTCQAPNAGAVLISVSGGTAPYTFDWSNDGQGDLNDPEDVTGLGKGDFSLRAVDVNGCATQNVFTIGLDADTIAPEIMCLENIVTCSPVVYFTTPQAIDNCGVKSVDRIDAKKLDSGSEFPVGNTTITFEATDYAGNSSSCSFVVTVLPRPQLFMSDNTTILPGQATQLMATTSVGNSVLWAPENLVVNPTSISPIVMPDVTTVFTVVVTDSQGCTNEGSVIISVDKNQLSINNILTPNGDGLNDTWQVNEPSLIRGCEVKIFNRWGKKVYHTSDYKNEWDGTQNGMTAQEGTYYYTIQCRNLSPFTGAVTLVGQSN
jgi:gliding motility-associated-like protein